MVAIIKNKYLPDFDPMTWVLSNEVRDRPLQECLLSNLFF